MRGRLVIVALATSVMVAVAFLVPLITLVRTVARDRAITSAERDGASLAPVLSLGVQPDEVALAIANTPAGVEGRMTVVLPNGMQIGQTVPTDDELELALRGTSFSVDHADGTAVYTAVTTRSGTSVVRVQVPSALLREGVNRATWSLMALAAVLVVVAVVVSDRLGASMVRPVRNLADAADRLGRGDLSQRVEPEGPAELEAVGEAFNLLAARVTELLESERELVADLSHRLRTPLTVLRIESDALSDAVARERLRSAVVELENTVTALIAEARRPITADVTTLVDVAAVTRERVAFWSALAEDQGRELRTDVPDGAMYVRTDVGELEAAIDALLGNVFEHTPDGTVFAVSVRATDNEHVALVIEDGGPGMGAGDVERGRSRRGSTGLGLDIAKRTAEAAGGRLDVSSSDLGGACVTLELPCAPRSPR